MALLAFGGVALSIWIALRWGPAWAMTVAGWRSASSNPSALSPGALNPAVFSPAWIAAVMFGLPAIVLMLAAFRPAIEIYETHLKLGHREIPWSRIRRLDQTGWTVPLAVHLTLDDRSRSLIIYPGDLNSSSSLLRLLRRYSREALLDGVPYRQFWGEPPAPERKQLAPPRYRLLRPEEEEEVERMLQRLKSVGHLDQRKQDEE